MSAPPARHALAVVSGKGGVGKSTVSLNLALALAREGAAVGLLDADVYGPDIPVMVGLTRKHELRRWDLWRQGDVGLEPVELHGLELMSVGFLLGERQMFPSPADLLRFVLHQLVHGVAWGELDYLVVDLPPGTADLQQELLRTLGLAGALVVVGPQDVAHLDAKRVLTLLREAGVRVLGAVENMTALACPHCGGLVEVFPPVAEERSVWAEGVERLARLPLDPALARPNPAEAPPAPFPELAARLAEKLLEPA